ncbi:MAG: hypothetical protein QXR84_08715 [Candidatus Bathyarchaeia archaeon]
MMKDPTTKTDSGLKLLKVGKIVASIMLIMGALSFYISVFYASSILAFIGLGLTFWGSLLLYIAPSRYIKLELLNAVAVQNLTNIEKVIANMELNEKGIYLPPKYLKDFESSLIFIPSKTNYTLPEPEEIDEEKLYSKNPEGVFLTPPGLALLKLFEKELGTSFLRADLNYIQNYMPKLFIEDLEISENVEIDIEDNIVTIEITDHIFSEICWETRKMERTHKVIGCPLCSAIACALAKATGKPIIMLDEEINEGEKVTKIKYQILEG